MLSISPVEVIEKKRVDVQSSKIRNGPMGFDEKKFPYNIFIRHLLKPSDLKGERCRVGDLNWSSQLYSIRESLVQKNQLILYWLTDSEGNSPERSFVAEELQIIPPDTELPPQWILAN